MQPGASEPATHAYRSSASRVDGWKAIADFFGRTVRTVQRWERQEGLPIHRHQHTDLSSVFAYTWELERWRTERLPARGTPGTQSLVGDNPEALCAMSREHWAERTKEGLAKSIALAHAALQRKADFALAYGLLAKAHVTRASYGHSAPIPDLSLAEDAATEALRIDPRNVEAHQALAYAGLFKLDWARARRHFETALELNPREPTTYQWFSFWHIARGKESVALEMSGRAEELDPTSLILAAHMAWMFHLSGRYDDAIRHARGVIRRNRHFWRGYFNLSLTLAAIGKSTEAMQAMDLAAALGDQTNIRAARVHMLAVSGEMEHAQTDFVNLVSNECYRSGYWMAFAAAGLDRRGVVINQLNIAFEQNEWFVILLDHDPAFARYRSTPAVKSLIERIGSH